MYLPPCPPRHLRLYWHLRHAWPELASALSPALAHFLYISKATVPFDEEALEGLLVSARRFNEAHEITGLLLCDEVHVLRLAQFCQYVGGPPSQ